MLYLELGLIIYSFLDIGLSGISCPSSFQVDWLFHAFYPVVYFIMVTIDVTINTVFQMPCVFLCGVWRLPRAWGAYPKVASHIPGKISGGLCGDHLISLWRNMCTGWLLVIQREVPGGQSPFLQSELLRSYGSKWDRNSRWRRCEITDHCLILTSDKVVSAFALVFQHQVSSFYWGGVLCTLSKTLMWQFSPKFEFF